MATGTSIAKKQDEGETDVEKVSVVDVDYRGDAQTLVHSGVGRII